MKPINVFSRAAVLAAVLAFGPAHLHAETISQNNGVTTIRGVDDADAAEQRLISRGRSGVTVFRGSSNALPPAPIVEDRPAPLQVHAGQRLWIYDANNDQVSACSIWYDYYGIPGVVCTPRY